MLPTLLILSAQSLDLATFGLALHHFGIAGEVNPLAAILIGNGSLVAVKWGGAIAAAMIVRRLPRALIFAAGFGILGAASNVAALAVAR